MSDLIFKTVGLGDAAVEYLAAWDLQREVHAGVADGGTDTVLLLEHPPVYTAGKRTEPHERPSDGTPSSTWTAAARSPSTGRASSSATRSSGSPST